MGEQVAAGSNGGVAQLGEHLPCKQGVKSSNLSVSTGYGDTQTVERVRIISHDRKGATFSLYLENRILKILNIKKKKRHPKQKG